MCSNFSMSVILDVSRFLKFKMTSSTKAVSYSLFCEIDNLEVQMISSSIRILIERGA